MQERAHALYIKRLRPDLDSMVCPLPQVEIAHWATPHNALQTIAARDRVAISRIEM
jgi:hypothetical protein